MKNKNGQVLVGVIVLLAILAILIPAMVKYVEYETKWSTKESENSNAFQLAEGAVDRGFQKMAESTTTWKNLMAGQTFAGYRFDTSYTDLSGGSYTMLITSGPLEQQATVYTVGRDKNNRETRALKVVFANASLTDVSIAAASGVTMNGNNIEVEWGAVTSPAAISILTKLHPSFWSAAGIDKDSNGNAPPNNDASNWWWHSYYTGLPPTPTIDFEAYKSSAIAAGNDPCGNAYYQPGNFSGNCNSLNGKTYYIVGNRTDFRSAITGSMIILGNLDFKNGSQDTVGAYNATVPPLAWKQYCNDWAYYRAEFDNTPPASPACFGNIGNSYRSSGDVVSIDPAIHGLLYVGGNLSLPNGGGSDDLLHGVIIVNGVANINTNSNCKIYYDPSIASNILATSISLSRVSWADATTAWPSALP